MTNIENYKNQLKLNGYLHIRNFFEDNEIETIRKYAEETNYTDKENFTEIFSIDKINKIFLSEKYLKFVSELFGKDVYYFGNSSIYYDHNQDVKEFHVDARDDIDLKYEHDYPVYRMGIYLQDHDELGGGIKFKIKSHRKIYISCLNYGD